MSGSISYFRYTTDDGIAYHIKADKSNVAAVNASGAGQPASLPVAAVPRNIKIRYALFQDSTGLIKRKVPLLTLADRAALDETTSFVPQGETATVRLRFVRGEQVSIPQLVDSGRTT